MVARLIRFFKIKIFHHCPFCNGLGYHSPVLPCGMCHTSGRW